MICSKCHRSLSKPAAVYAGRMYGPICARVMGIVTVITRPGPLFTKLTRIERDQLDLFNATKETP